MMNLAEIRKKAQLQRRPPESVAVTADEVLPPVGSPEEEVPEPATSAPELEQFVEEPSETVFVETSPDHEPQETARPFDPLAQILAGRLTAGTAADYSEAAEVNPAGDGESVLKYLCFRLADEDYGISLLDIREIIKARPVTDVPRMPRFVAGVLSLRGTIIPVFDLRLRLGFDAGEPTGLERIIVIRRDEGSIGLLVDEVHQVVGLPFSEINDAPQVLEGVDREFVKGIGHHGQRMLILLDLDKVLDVFLR